MVAFRKAKTEASPQAIEAATAVRQGNGSSGDSMIRGNVAGEKAVDYFVSQASVTSRAIVSCICAGAVAFIAECHIPHSGDKKDFGVVKTLLQEKIRERGINSRSQIAKYVDPALKMARVLVDSTTATASGVKEGGYKFGGPIELIQNAKSAEDATLTLLNWVKINWHVESFDQLYTKLGYATRGKRSSGEARQQTANTPGQNGQPTIPESKLDTAFKTADLKPETVLERYRKTEHNPLDLVLAGIRMMDSPDDLSAILKECQKRIKYLKDHPPQGPSVAQVVADQTVQAEAKTAKAS